MSDEKKRIIDQPVDTELSPGDYILVDSSSNEGTRQFDLGSELRDIKADLQSIIDGGIGLSDEAKQALLACFQNVAWIDDDGQDYYDALHNALYRQTLLSLSCVFTQSGVVATGDNLDDLKSDLVVTAHWSDGTTSTVASTAYTLSGTLTEGTSSVTVTYDGKTTSFSVVVSHTSVSYLESSGTQYIDTGLVLAFYDEVENHFRDSVETVGTDQVYWGVNDNNKRIFQGGYHPSSSTNNYSGRWTGNGPTSGMTRQVGVDVVIKHLNNTATSKTVAIYNTSGTLISSGNTSSDNVNSTPTLDIYLFAYNINGTASNFSTIRVYEFIVKNQSGTERLHFVPVTKNGTPCMYDLVSGTYFYNSGTGSFTYA